MSEFYLQNKIEIENNVDLKIWGGLILVEEFSL